MSREKGAVFERDFARKLKGVFGVDVKRTGAQERWKAHGGDVNAPEYSKTILTNFFWELKNRETWSILDWYKKARDDNGSPSKIPVVVATKNREEEYVFLSFKDFSRILLELDGYRKGE